MRVPETTRLPAPSLFFAICVLSGALLTDATLPQTKAAYQVYAKTRTGAVQKAVLKQWLPKMERTAGRVEKGIRPDLVGSAVWLLPSIALCNVLAFAFSKAFRSSGVRREWAYRAFVYYYGLRELACGLISVCIAPFLLFSPNDAFTLYTMGILESVLLISVIVLGVLVHFSTLDTVGRGGGFAARVLKDYVALLATIAFFFVAATLFDLLHFLLLESLPLF